MSESHIAKNLKALMDRENISQNELGRIAGVTSASASHWFNGGSIRLDKIDIICEYFSLSKDDLLSERYGLYEQQISGKNKELLGNKKAKCRYVVELSETLFNKVEQFRKNNNLDTLNAATVELVEQGLSNTGE